MCKNPEKESDNILKAGHVYSPNSVIEAVDSKEFGNYWSGTETYESLLAYIAMDFDGLRQLIVDMLGGARRRIDVESFQNDITSFHSADDVITLLIHMGYLAYDNKDKEVFIPNEEVRSSFLRAIKNDGWDEVIKAVNASETLLKATLAMDERIVAQMIQEVHETILHHAACLSILCNLPLMLSYIQRGDSYSTAHSVSSPQIFRIFILNGLFWLHILASQKSFVFTPF